MEQVIAHQQNEEAIPLAAFMLRHQAEPSLRPLAIVDDSLDDRMILKRELEALTAGNSKILVFASGAELINYLDTHTSDNDRPRMIFLDILMHGLDGLTTLDILQGRLAHASIPVVAVSGTRDGQQVKNAINGGVKAFLTKPVSRQEMTSVLQGKTGAGGTK